MKLSPLSLTTLSLLLNFVSANANDPSAIKTLLPRWAAEIIPPTTAPLKNCRKTGHLCSCDDGRLVGIYTTVEAGTTYAVCKGSPYPTVATLSPTPLSSPPSSLALPRRSLQKRIPFGERESLSRGDDVWTLARSKGVIVQNILTAALGNDKHSDVPCFDLGGTYDVQPTARGQRKIASTLRGIVADLQIPESDSISFTNLVARWPKAAEQPDAAFMDAFSVKAGILVADANNRHPDGQPDRKAPHNWSSVVWEMWRSVCVKEEAPTQGLKWVFRQNVVNPCSRSLMTVMGEGKWEGGSEEFEVLLGSPNGSGVGHLLADHKTGLGGKGIGSIAVRKSVNDGGDEWHMVIELV